MGWLWPETFLAAGTGSGGAASAAAGAAASRFSFRLSLRLRHFRSCACALPPASSHLAPRSLRSSCPSCSSSPPPCRRCGAFLVMAQQQQDGGLGSPVPAQRPPQSAFSAIEFLTLCQSLKITKRAGWVNHEVRESESIADHMYRMAIMALVAPELPGVNRDRTVKMAVVHDIAEAIVGDITPADNIPKEQKSALERAAIEDMCSLLGEGPAADEVKELWSEYEDNITPEAKLVKDFDKVELILQAVEYEKAQGKNLDDFFRTTAGKFQTDLGKAWAAEVVSRRPHRSDAGLPTEASTSDRTH